MKFLTLLFLMSCAALVSRGLAAASEKSAPAIVSPALRGVRLVPDAAAVEVAAEGIDLRAVPLLATGNLRDTLAAHLGQPLRIPDIATMIRETELAYAKLGYPFVRVTVPPQDITSGVLTLVVIEAKLGAVRITGANRFSSASYTRTLGVALGEPINARTVREDVAVLNQHPFRSVNSSFAPGERPGETDLVLEVSERRPLRFSTGYNDTGTRTTDRDRVFAGLTWGNAFGRGDQLGYHFSGDPHLDHLRSHALTYSTALARQRTFSLTATHADITSDVPVPFVQSGSSSSLGLRYAFPLRLREGIHAQLTFGADYKRSDNNLLFSTIPITNNLTEIVQGSVTFSAQRPDRFGATDAAVSLIVSPGGLAPRNYGRYFESSRFAARADYVYGAIDLGRAQRLPHDFTWRATLRGQLSSGNLLGSEQLGVGGVGSVRGYNDGEVYGDEGVLVSNELRLPPLRALARFSERLADSVQPLVFVDYGWAHVHTPLEDEDANYELLGAGAGLRYRLGRYLTASADYGWQLKTAGLGNRSGSRARRMHMNVSLAW